MKKISIEITEDKFLYDYVVGKNRGNGDSPICPDSLGLFTEVLNACHKSYARRTEKEMNDIRCMAYIETHPEMIAKYKELKKGR